MKKKFMVVALMAALSTVGYAGNFKLPNNSVGGPLNVVVQVDKTNENFGAVSNAINGLQDEVAGKADANDVYTKEEANNKFASKDEINGKVNQSDFDALQGQVNTNRDNIAALDEQLFGTGTTGGVINNINSKNNEQDTAIETNKQNIETNKQNIETNKQNITNLQQTSNNHEARITHLEDRVDRLDEKMNEGLSLMAAMNAVDFQNVQAGEMAIGAGFGHYGNAQSVAVGVAYAPTDNFNVNVKYSATAGNPESFAIGAGASYKFKVGR